MLPADDFSMLPNDEILMCSTKSAERLVKTNLTNVYTLDYLVSGIVPIRGYVMSWLASLKTPSEERVP